jgi:hypothetical protein
MLALLQSVSSSLDIDGLLSVKFLDYTVKGEYSHEIVSELTAEVVVLPASMR